MLNKAASNKRQGSLTEYTWIYLSAFDRRLHTYVYVMHSVSYGIIL